MNEMLIFNEIITALFMENSCSSFEKNRIEKIMQKHTVKANNCDVSNIFYNDNLSQSTFCLAYNNLKIVDSINLKNSKSTFEILLFNCIICFQKISSTNIQWQEYIHLLIHYLDVYNLTKQIENLSIYFEQPLAILGKENNTIFNERVFLTTVFTLITCIEEKTSLIESLSM